MENFTQAVSEYWHIFQLAFTDLFMFLDAFFKMPIEETIIPFLIFMSKVFISISILVLFLSTIIISLSAIIAPFCKGDKLHAVELSIQYWGWILHRSLLFILYSLVIYALCKGVLVM